MNNAVLVGRLTKDPELRYIPESGTAVATFTLAVNRDFTKKDGTREADFVPIEVMGKAAEFCANYLTKGRLVACNGQIRVENYKDKNGDWKNFTKVNCLKVDALDSKKDNTGAPSGADGPAFEPEGGYPAVDDDDIPF